ncbi:hypothetical protein [Halomonas sp. TD01]|uniref:hypothetical protein n=1 Tax=Halomonas sp. TD01 TaxID=999141 RepID=UPI000214F2B8|nr:hypothetical protein [Halomonas sp. TD01]EGP18405.1 hypothetical protein GME_16642 [Halomonas sp. TD01]CAH1044519.1 Phage protein [Halomonas sp. TD01]
MPKERPILFNAAMVRAILNGHKTQTRRAMKPQPAVHVDHFRHVTTCARTGRMDWQACNKAKKPVYAFKKKPCFVTEIAQCPYGQPGDRLWVRETWGVVSHSFDANGERSQYQPDRPATPIQEMPFGQGYYHGHVIYAADGAFEWAGDDDGGGNTRSAWKPSIHMPRIASRITLEIVRVRVERLQDISKEDATAEGIEPPEGETYRDYAVKPEDNEGHDYYLCPQDSFISLWEKINGLDSCKANPWVWVIEFKRVEASQ